MKKIQYLQGAAAFLLASSSALAAPQCWKAEGFSSEASFEKQRQDWRAEAVPAPAPWHMLTAYNVFKHERAFALSRFKSDKQVHCYMGCRIAQDANFQAAQWAGWKKEDKDINEPVPIALANYTTPPPLRTHTLTAISLDGSTQETVTLRQHDSAEWLRGELFKVFGTAAASQKKLHPANPS